MENNTENTNNTVVEETVSQMTENNMIRCEHCGGMVNAHTSVCPKCGADLDSHKAVVSTESVGFTDPSEIRKKRLIICAVIICALLVLFGFFRLMSYRSIIKEAKALNAEIEAIEEVSSDDGDKLRDLQYHYDYLPDSAKKYVTSYDYLKKLESLQEALEVQDTFANLSSEEEIRNMDVDEIEKFLSQVQSAQQKYHLLDDDQKEYLNGRSDLIKNADNLVKLAEDTKTALLQPTATPVVVKPTQKPQQQTQTNTAQSNNKNEVLCGVPCAFSDYNVTYNSFSLSSDYEGNDVIVENLTFENLSSEARPFFTTAAVTMYQDGIQLESAYFVDGCDYGLSQTKLQQGASLDVQQAHVLRNTTSPVYIEITDWISFNGKKYTGVIPLS